MGNMHQLNKFLKTGSNVSKLVIIIPETKSGLWLRKKEPYWRKKNCRTVKRYSSHHKQKLISYENYSKIRKKRVQQELTDQHVKSFSGYELFAYKVHRIKFSASIITCEEKQLYDDYLPRKNCGFI